VFDVAQREQRRIYGATRESAVLPRGWLSSKAPKPESQRRIYGATKSQGRSSRAAEERSARTASTPSEAAAVAAVAAAAVACLRQPLGRWRLEVTLTAGPEGAGTCTPPRAPYRDPQRRSVA
jgi:hypothetical protein